MVLLRVHLTAEVWYARVFNAKPKRFRPDHSRFVVEPDVAPADAMTHPDPTYSA
jgi:hypothetical protein